MTVDVAEAVVAANANAGRKACIIIEGNEDNKLTFQRRSFISIVEKAYSHYYFSN